MEAATVTALEHRRRIVPWRMLGDDVLARRAAQGSESAFTALYERYHAPLLGYCRSILLNGDDAHDAAQSALEKALRALPDRNPDLPLRPWLYRIAHNEAIDIVRRRGKHLRLVPGLDEPASPGPDVDAEQRGRLTQLVDDLRTLPERQRGALVMRELSGLEYEEIGDALGVTPTAARQAVFEARTALHACSDGREDDCTAIRRTLSDGDGRALRGRRLRAHLRSCEECRVFGTAIGARRSDLSALGPWLSGATAAGVFGVGAGTAGGGAVVATSTLGGAAGGGISWAGLPAAAKGIAVAAAVATGGTAAFEIKDVVVPAKDTPSAARAAQSPSTQGASSAEVRSPAVLAAASDPDRRAAGDALRTSTRNLRTSVAGPLAQKQALAAPALEPVRAIVKPVAELPTKTASTIKTTTRKAGGTLAATEELVRRSLLLARERVLQAFALAQRTVATGAPGALDLARTTLGVTLRKIAARLEPLLAKVGLKLPAPGATAPAAAPSDLAKILAKPLQSVFSGLQELFRKLFGRLA